MPQLDLMHFFSQFFWFSLFFIFLFFYTYLKILPLLLKNLKYRIKKLFELSFEISCSKKDVLFLCFFHTRTISDVVIFFHKKLDFIAHVRFQLMLDKVFSTCKSLISFHIFYLSLINGSYINFILKNVISLSVLNKNKKC
jgi:hypothetical protein